MLIEITYNVTDVFVSTTQTPIYVSVSFEQPSSGGGTWGSITGTLSNQTDLQTALDGKFDDPTGTTSQYLRGDGSLATFPAIPSGTVSSVGLTMPSAFSVANSPVTSSGTLAVTGAGTTAQYIRGDGSLDTFPSLTGFVPYTGATANVDLGTHRIIAQNATISSSGSGDTVTITHSSGSGVGLNITKGGNGEGLYINKTGGSGNAATIIGTINATTLVKSGGTSSQFLKADGTVDSSVYVPTSREITINGVTFDLSANRSWTVSGGISGSGASGQVAYWTGTSAQSGSNNLFWDAANGRLGIGTNTPAERLHVVGNATYRGLYPYFELVPTGWSGGNFYLQAGVNDNGSTAGNYTVFFNSQTTRGFSWVQNSSPRMALTPSNNLLIQNGGTFTDGGQRLQVQGTTLLNGNVTFSSATGMTWDATNSRLGIGTNAPSGRLHVFCTNFADVSIFERQPIFTNAPAASAILRSSYAVSPSNGAGTNFAFQIRVGATNNDIAAFGGIRDGADNSGALSFLTVNAGTQTEKMRVTATGNTMLQNGGTFTDSGERLQVTGNVKVTGAGTGATNGLLVTNSAASSLLAVRNDGLVLIGASASRVYFMPVNALNTSLVNGTALQLQIHNTNARTTTGFDFVIHSTQSDYTSGSVDVTRIVSTFAPTSGTGVINSLTLTPTINQVGATGVTRGLYVNPTLTSAADFRAIETARGNIVFGNLPTSSAGLPTGAIWNDAGTIKIV
jgi:hypothetical protein